MDYSSDSIAYQSRQGSKLFTDKRGIRPSTAAAKIFVNRRDSPQDKNVTSRPNSVHLSGLKDMLYHPRLPSLRKMDQDTTLHQLADAHSRHNTYATRKEFTDATLADEVPLLHILHTTDTGISLQSPETAPSGHIKMDWRLVVTLPPSKSENEQDENEENRRIIIGYIPRKWRSEATSSWRYTLKEGPCIDYSLMMQKPVSATIFSRYRGTWASTANNKARPWRG